MKRGIFGKVLWANVMILVISMTVTAASLFALLGGYLKNEREGKMLASAKQVVAATQNILSGSVPESVIPRILELYSDSGRALVFILDAGGVPLYRVGEKYLHANEDKITAGMIQGALAGRTTSTLGTFGGVFDEQTLTVLMPISYGRSVVAVLLMSTSMPQITQARTDVMLIFLIAILISAILSVIVSYFLSKKLTDPIKRISAAAKSIASGEFGERVDISSKDELGLLAVSFNRMAKSLEELEKMRSGFISNVSHELRTPMTTIGGFVEGILDGTIDQSDYDKYLTIVLSEIKRLSRLVNDLLDTARLESGVMELNITDFNVNQMIREIIVTYERAIMEKNIGVSVEFERDECAVSADGDAIHRVMVNLLDNALKFTPENGHLFIRSRVRGKKAEITVQNSGDGIDPEQLRRIWERFYKTDASRSVNKKGVGLGLFIVKAIVAAHKEEIRVESEKGKYTRFIFTLKITDI